MLASVRSKRAPRRTTAASPPRHYYALPSPLSTPPAHSPLPPRPSAQALPPALKPIGCCRRARVRPRRARPHWPPRGNVSHMQMRMGGADYGWLQAGRGRARSRVAGRAHCSKGSKPGGRFRVLRCRGPKLSVVLCPVCAWNTLTRGVADLARRVLLGGPTVKDWVNHP